VDVTDLVHARMMLLTHELEELHDPSRAWAYAERAWWRSGGSDSGYHDTLALAQHRIGDTASAVETQRRAIGRSRDGARTAEYEQRLAGYEAALSSEGEERAAG